MAERKMKERRGIPFSFLSPSVSSLFEVMRIALCVIATGKYTRFLPCLLESAAEFFCAGHEVRFFLFTDDCKLTIANCKFRIVNSQFAICNFLAPAEPWPGPTLHRYRTMLAAADELAGCDYVYYVDVDSRFVRPVGEEIFGALAATIHYGFCDKPRREFTYETRIASRACVRPRQGRRYYAGGFQGGRVQTYLAAMRTMAAAIADDERRGIVARWHDESHWNRYLIDHPPDVELSHEYCCPEPWRPETQRIVIVGKNNEELRG
jgi:histo-blood group ABO system transferase